MDACPSTCTALILHPSIRHGNTGTPSEPERSATSAFSAEAVGMYQIYSLRLYSCGVLIFAPSSPRKVPSLPQAPHRASADDLAIRH